MNALDNETIEALSHLSASLDKLRSECAWNAKQTVETLRYLTVEEVYELSEAIAVVMEKPDDAKCRDELKKELSDLLMHIFFYAKVAFDNGWFALADIADAATKKMIDRHPHIFAAGGGAVDVVPWEKVKMREGRRSVLEGVPETLPPLVKAVRMQEKAEGAGYGNDEVDNDAQNVDYVAAALSGDAAVFGDALLSLLHLAHGNGINADNALMYANLRYRQRVEEWEKMQRGES